MVLEAQGLAYVEARVTQRVLGINKYQCHVLACKLGTSHFISHDHRSTRFLMVILSLYIYGKPRRVSKHEIYYEPSSFYSTTHQWALVGKLLTVT